eukprot:GHVO01013524.1.p1 GENE.GHVO01013524.1~~GHVO01013524.1.p1  ORF type:complete len:196 (-),score=23.11 GHVO01013524.1:675-1175(-)
MRKILLRVAVDQRCLVAEGHQCPPLPILPAPIQQVVNKIKAYTSVDDSWPMGWPSELREAYAWPPGAATVGEYRSRLKSLPPVIVFCPPQPHMHRPYSRPATHAAVRHSCHRMIRTSPETRCALIISRIKVPKRHMKASTLGFETFWDIHFHPPNTKSRRGILCTV